MDEWGEGHAAGCGAANNRANLHVLHEFYGSRPLFSIGAPLLYGPAQAGWAKHTISFRSRWLVQKFVPSNASARAAKGMWMRSSNVGLDPLRFTRVSQ